VIEIAEHQAGATAADFAGLTGRGFTVGIIVAPDADLVAGARAPAGFDDALGRVIGQRVLVRAGFRHARAAMRNDAVLPPLGNDRRRRGGARDPETAHRAY